MLQNAAALKVKRSFPHLPSFHTVISTTAFNADPKFLFLLLLFCPFLSQSPNLVCLFLPDRPSLVLPTAEKILAAVKPNGAPTINCTAAFCTQSAPGARVKRHISDAGTEHPAASHREDRRTLFFCITAFHRGVNPAMVISWFDGCQLCFLFR